ncbi:unnamed protein product [Phytophthora lilii]|uniref:Unnamed protein product n=1 Tax=Phytophthora lilii TaxID=2077276 RepID=A0A9W6UD97_9STRA|nr:unnamed protein product [Phytophthora lilii]
MWSTPLSGQAWDCEMDRDRKEANDVTVKMVELERAHQKVMKAALPPHIIFISDKYKVSNIEKWRTHMINTKLEGLNRLNIQAINWGSSYRAKVRGSTGKMVYVSNVSRPTNQKLLAKQHKISVETLKKHISPDYKTDPMYRFYGKHMASHLYEGIQPAEFYDKLENVLAGQTKAFKVNCSWVRSREPNGW